MATRQKGARREQAVEAVRNYFELKPQKTLFGKEPITWETPDLVNGGVKHVEKPTSGFRKTGRFVLGIWMVFAIRQPFEIAPVVATEGSNAAAEITYAGSETSQTILEIVPSALCGEINALCEETSSRITGVSNVLTDRESGSATNTAPPTTEQPTDYETPLELNEPSVTTLDLGPVVCFGEPINVPMAGFALPSEAVISASPILIEARSWEATDRLYTYVTGLQANAELPEERFVRPTDTIYNVPTDCRPR